MSDTGAPYFIPIVSPTNLVRNYPDFSADLADAIVDGLDLVADRGLTYAGTRYYTSNGTFAKANPLGTGDIGLRAIRVRMVGGGGGGASARVTGAGEVSVGCSGSGAAYAESLITESLLTSSEPVTVGTGGAGGTAGGNGANGGNSEFSLIIGIPPDPSTGLVQADGGLGGFSQGVESTTTGFPGVGGQSTGIGDLVFAGTASGNGFAVPGGFVISGPGGSSALGGGAGPVERFGSLGLAGANGENYGSGGSGGVNGPSQGTARNGGNGSAGIVIIDVFV
jgi:hypothetical protein